MVIFANCQNLSMENLGKAGEAECSVLVYTELNINRCAWRFCFNLPLTQLRNIIWLTKCSLSPTCFPSDSIKSSMFCPHCLVTSKHCFRIAFSTPWTLFNKQSVKPTSLELIAHLEKPALPERDDFTFVRLHAGLKRPESEK